VRPKGEARESHFMLLGMQKSVREWTLPLPSELSFLGVGVPVDSRIFIKRLQRSKFIGLKSSLYHQKNLGTWISELGLHDPFRQLKHKLWPNEGPEVKLAIDSWPLKVGNCPDFLAWRWCTTYYWKAFNKGYNFASNLILIGGLHTKLWAPKVVGVPTLGIPGQKTIWMLVQWSTTEYTIRGKVVASPKFRQWWVLWVQICPWLILASKVL
jgi:hypothetical protein